MSVSRIPIYDAADPNGITLWFAELSRLGLLFHPENAPETIVEVRSGRHVFSDVECGELREILGGMFAEHGDEVIESCYPIFMRAGGQMVALNS